MENTEWKTLNAYVSISLYPFLSLLQQIPNRETYYKSMIPIGQATAIQ